jgi:hypothetical protein
VFSVIVPFHIFINVMPRNFVPVLCGMSLSVNVTCGKMVFCFAWYGKILLTSFQYLLQDYLM